MSAVEQTSSHTASSVAATSATGSHPPSSAPDPTSTNPSTDNAQGGLPPTTATGSTELARLKVTLRNGLRQFPDFPSPGILFEDIMPIFASPQLHEQLITALELQVASAFHAGTGTNSQIDVVVGLESRGFLFGPTLAIRLGAGFVPVRKKGKLPGECVTEGFKKEYGEDFFQMQKDGIRPGQKVLVVDDIIATGGSAAAAGNLVRQIGGELVGYLFIMELDFLQGRAKLDAPVHTLLSGQEEALNS